MKRFVLKGGCIVMHDKDWPPVIRDGRAGEEILTFIVDAMNEKYNRMLTKMEPVTETELRKLVNQLEDWKKSAMLPSPDWQKIGEALDMKVEEDVPKQLLYNIFRLKNEIEMWKIQAKMARYGVDCVCKWEDNKVISFCCAHQMVADAMADARIKTQTDALAEKYRKLTEG